MSQHLKDRFRIDRIPCRFRIDPLEERVAPALAGGLLGDADLRGLALLVTAAGSLVGALVVAGGGQDSETASIAPPAAAPDAGTVLLTGPQPASDSRSLQGLPGPSVYWTILSVHNLTFGAAANTGTPATPTVNAGSLPVGIYPLPMSFSSVVSTTSTTYPKHAPVASQGGGSRGGKRGKGSHAPVLVAARD